MHTIIFLPKSIRHIVLELKDQYLEEDRLRPWIIGFSGGKDSTALLQLVWSAIEEIPPEKRNRKIYVVCNDTLVENPIIQKYVEDILLKIEQATVKQGLTIIEVQKTKPKLNDTFWVNVIGRGYPVPNNIFRWCTDRMKIRPTSRFILEQVAKNGDAIILVGTRRSESAARARTIGRHEIPGKRLTKHPLHKNTFVYAPIKELMLEEVWYIINKIPLPWGNSSGLFTIYANANADDYECPVVVTDQTHTSCGQSRFGCWTCTVVREDKSLSAQVNNGQDWLKPLVDLRAKMLLERNHSGNRERLRRNGQEAIAEDGRFYGNYSMKYRVRLLKEVLTVQKEMQRTDSTVKLIAEQELIAIQTIWRSDLGFQYKVSDIYKELYSKKMDMKNSDEQHRKEMYLLKSCCDDPSDGDLIEDLLLLLKQKSLLLKKKGLKNEMELVIEKYLKKEQDMVNDIPNWHMPISGANCETINEVNS